MRQRGSEAPRTPNDWKGRNAGRPDATIFAELNQKDNDCDLGKIARLGHDVSLVTLGR
jgi:hypothetical protein